MTSLYRSPLQMPDGGCRAGSSCAAFVALLLLLLSLAPPAIGQEGLDDILGGIGTAETLDEEAENEAARQKQRPGEGTVGGQVFDADSGAAVAAVTIILEPDDGAEREQEVTTTNYGGSFEFPSVPEGTYRLSFIKSGYRASVMGNLEVRAGVLNRADFPLPKVVAASSDEIIDLDMIVVDASVVGDMMTALELRTDSDAIMNVMTAEDFSRYAASDVAEALRRVAGVNVVEGKFAFVRGLEDRYSSTLYNGAVVPSPDPNRQSVQLDLFPSEVVSNMAVSKSATPWLPSNSAAGSIDIVTHEYPEEFSVVLELAAGFNENAIDEFLRFERGSPMGSSESGLAVLGGEAGLSVGGRREVLRREVRAKGVFNWKRDFDTLQGFQEGLEPRRGNTHPRRGNSGDLALGQLSLTDGRFRLTQSNASERYLGYFGLGFDIDTEGNHKIDTSVFYIHKTDETVFLRFDGYFPDFQSEPPADGYPRLFDKYVVDNEVGYSDFDSRATQGSWIGGNRALREFNDNPPNKPAWWTNFQSSSSFLTERDLLITQINGDHTIGQVEGLSLSWAANYARTQQFEESRGSRFYFEPTVQPDWTDSADRPNVPIRLEDLGPDGLFTTNSSVGFVQTDIDESQGFGRFDAQYDRDLMEEIAIALSGGAWYEHASRGVSSSFLESPRKGTELQWFIQAETPEELGRLIDEELNKNADGSLVGLRDSVNESKREIAAGHMGLEATFWDDFDVFGGVRIENIFIESLNDPYTEGDVLGAPRTYPVVYVHFDRLDNNLRGEVPRNFDPDGKVFNDQILGIDVPVDVPCPLIRDPDYVCVDLLTREDIDSFTNGRIDELKFLPSAGLTYRPFDGFAIRGAFSRTVARPSFREMGFYVTVEPGSDDLIVGNPQLELSEVQSFGGRVEYSWGDLGDMVAFSAFYKEIDKPIEAIVLRDPTNFEDAGNALFRTYFNNPNQANIWGVEAEIYKALDFIGLEIGKYFAISANYSYFDAKVNRSDAELRRAEDFFYAWGDDEALYTGLEPTRRLFGQPEWIANAAFSFDHPDWGTRFTLAFFGISDVLDAAGSAVIAPSGTTGALTLDRYQDEFHQLDLILRQTIRVDAIGGDLTFKFRIKNLTDSTRRIVYDPNQLTDQFVEREYKRGRDYKFSIVYEF